MDLHSLRPQFHAHRFGRTAIFRANSAMLPLLKYAFAVSDHRFSSGVSF